MLADGVRVGPFVQIGERTTIGRNTFLHAGTFIGDDVVIGDDCQIFPNVSVRERVTIGHRVILNAGCAIGTDGFGSQMGSEAKQHMKIPHIGTVIFEDDTSRISGSCSCASDRAKISPTRESGSRNQARQPGADRLTTSCWAPTARSPDKSASQDQSTIGAGVVIGGQTAVSSIT